MRQRRRVMPGKDKRRADEPVADQQQSGLRLGFGERQEFVSLLESRASLAAEVLGDPQSVQYREVKDRARSPGFCYEAAGMTEDFGNLGMHVALRLHQRHGQSDVKLELRPLAFARIRQIV